VDDEAEIVDIGPAQCDVCGLELLEEPRATEEGLSLQLNCMVHGTRMEWTS